MILQKIGGVRTAGFVIAILSMALFGAGSAAVATTAEAHRSAPPVALAAAETAQPDVLARSEAHRLQLLNSGKFGLKVGDLVRFASGGPMMTVRAIKGGKATCYWMNQNGRLQSGRYPIAELVAIGGPGHELSRLTERRSLL